ncbi:MULTISPECIES: helix-turn-helix transcriptional regulator [Saccharopolyspora]|uniref:Helix-turn-helix transcriptional regulator n=1 Tax=Saccharopolyspora cebuensis TaxID=418759 RepID=A0ABV4CF44_9PSEU
MTSASQRLPRLLALVPYLLSRPGVLVAEAAADFGVTEAQLRRDLELLWMCGLPGYGPGDLIDLSFESDSITVTYDAGMRRPLRLTASEATALLVALRALAETPGITDTGAVRRALAKVEDAVGQARPAGVVVGLEGRESFVRSEVRAAVQDATTRRRAARIRYYTISRDEISDRVVDPMRLLLLDGRSYLEAWCRAAGGVRLFRLDRIDDAEVLDEVARPPADAEPTDVSGGLFRPDPEQPSAELELSPDARWVAEYYPVEDVEELPGGSSRVRMRYSDRSWMVRLVLGQGGLIRVLAPDDLAVDVRRRAEAALARAGHLAST